jgi:hypothetical protein
VFGGNTGLGDVGHFLVGKVFEANHPAVAPLEALIFSDRQKHQPVAPVARYGEGLCQGLVRQGAELLPKLSQ